MYSSSENGGVWGHEVIGQADSAGIDIPVVVPEPHSHLGRSSVSCLAFSQTGQYLAVGVGSAVQVVDISSRTKSTSGGSEYVRAGEVCLGPDEFDVVTWLEGPPYNVKSVAFSPDGRILAVAGRRGIGFWDTASWSRLVVQSHGAPPRRVLPPHCLCVAFSSDGTGILSVSSRGEVLLLDLTAVAEMQAVSTLPSFPLLSPPHSIDLSSDARRLAYGAQDNTVRLWDIESGKEILVLTGHTDEVSSVAVGPYGKLLASGSKDKTIRLWDLSSGELVATLEGHTGVVNCVSFSSNGKYLVSGSNDETARVWDVAGRHEILVLASHRRSVADVAFSPDDSLLASGSWDETVRLWEAGVLREPRWSRQMLSGVLPLKGPTDPLREAACLEGRTSSGHSGVVGTLAFCSEEPLLASGSDDGCVGLWDLARDEEIGMLCGHTGSVNSVAFSPDGRQLASGSRDCTIKLWDIGSRKGVATLLGHAGSVMSLGFSPNGELLASGSRDGTVRLWGLRGPECSAILGKHKAPVNSVAFASDGSLLAAGLADNTVRLWDVGGRRRIATLVGHVPADWSHAGCLKRGVCSVAFNPCRRELAAGFIDGTVCLWDVPSRARWHSRSWRDARVRLEPREGTGTCCAAELAYSSDGRFLASAARGRAISLWDPCSGREMATFGAEDGFSTDVESVAFSPNGRWLAVASYYDGVALWGTGLCPLGRLLADVVSGSAVEGEPG